MARHLTSLFLAWVLTVAPLGPAMADAMLYAVESSEAPSFDMSLYTVDPSDASASLVGPLGSDGFIHGLTYDVADDVLYGAASNPFRLFSIDPATGVATHVSPLDAWFRSLAFHNPTRTLYSIALGPGDEQALYEIDPSDGQATLIGGTGLPVGSPAVTGLACHPLTGVLYAVTFGESGGSLVTINRTNGVATFVAPTRSLSGLAFHPDTYTLYGHVADSPGSTQHLYTVAIESGASIHIGDTGLDAFFGIAFVPEPATLSLLALGILLAAERRRLASLDRGRKPR